MATISTEPTTEATPSAPCVAAVGTPPPSRRWWEAPRRPRVTARDCVRVAASVGAFALCVAALLAARRADLALMNDLGLVSVLPALYFVALAVLTLTFVLSLRHAESRTLALAIHLVVLTMMLYGIAPLMEETTRTAIAWKLRGIEDYILRSGQIDPEIDAFFNWPGFFVLVAFFTQLAGIGDATNSFPAWSPVFFNLLYLVPLFVLLRAASPDPRVRWLGLWLFLLANWIGQDYLAPQALNFFFYLVLMGVLVAWFSRVGPVPSTPLQRAALMAFVIVIFAAIVPSHQLTPMAAIAAVGMLVLFNRITTRGLPVLMVLLVLMWISYMAVTYLAGHFEHVTAPVGAVGENLNANLTDRFRGSSEHQAIAWIRSGTSAFVWLLALVGAIRRARRGRADATLALLAGTPFLLLPMQAYGGELLLRVYLFSLPAMVFFAASAFLARSESGISWLASTGIAIASLVLAGGFLLSRYGDERKDYVTAAEVAGVQKLYEIAPPQSRFVSLNKNVAWRYREYDTHRYVTAEKLVLANGRGALVTMMRNRDRPTYLLVTRSQLAFEEVFNGRSAVAWQAWRRNLLASGTVEPVFSNEGTEIFAAVDPPVPPPPVPFQRVLP